MSAITEAEITDRRLDVIAHAREVLERAVSECLAWRGPRHGGYLRVTAAMAALEGALRGVDTATCEEDKDHTVRLCAHWSVRVVAVVEDVMGREAACYVACGQDGSEDMFMSGESEEGEAA